MQHAEVGMSKTIINTNLAIFQFKQNREHLLLHKLLNNLYFLSILFVYSANVQLKLLYNFSINAVSISCALMPYLLFII